MDVFVARQPIFDLNMNIYGYEILYRKGNVNKFEETDGDKASSVVIIDSFQVFGIDEITDGKKAFINFTDNLLKKEVATLFPKDKLVIEILESVIPSEEIIEKCKSMKDLGYMIALDDFVYKDEFMPLLAIADMVKIDFMQTGPTERKEIINKLSTYNLKFLAEKIETIEEFHEAKALGYSYFQGYFFSKPVIMSTKDISPMKFNYLQIIQKVNQPEFEMDSLAKIISQDVSLTYKLLRLVNSPAFGFRYKMESVQMALVALGVKEIKKWVSLIALKGIGEDKPGEVIRLSLVRAKFAEYFSEFVAMKNFSHDLFMMELFSLIDVLMSRPLEDIFSEIKINTDIKDALLKFEGPYREVMELILAYERADWDKITEFSNNYQISQKRISKAYVDAVAWANKIFSAE